MPKQKKAVEQKQFMMMDRDQNKETAMEREEKNRSTVTSGTNGTTTAKTATTASVGGASASRTGARAGPSAKGP